MYAKFCRITFLPLASLYYLTDLTPDSLEKYWASPVNMTSELPGSGRCRTYYSTTVRLWRTTCRALTNGILLDVV